MLIVLLYQSIELEKRIRVVVLLLLSLSILVKIPSWNVDSRILGVDFVDYIDKGSIFDVGYSANR